MARVGVISSKHISFSQGHRFDASFWLDVLGMVSRKQISMEDEEAVRKVIQAVEEGKLDPYVDANSVVDYLKGVLSGLGVSLTVVETAGVSVEGACRFVLRMTPANAKKNAKKEPGKVTVKLSWREVDGKPEHFAVDDEVLKDLKAVAKRFAFLYVEKMLAFEDKTEEPGEQESFDRE